MKSDITNEIISYIVEKYGASTVVALYGIGSAFVDTDFSGNDVDVVVILRDVSQCPRKEYTTAIFEDYPVADGDRVLNVTFLYGTLEDYQNKDRFKVISFADWSWSVRGLKHSSTMIYGTDIRDKLPNPPYDYGSIFLRSAYHLNGTKRYDLRTSFQKSVFKFGFFLTAAYYPDANTFDKRGIGTLLHTAVADGYISPVMAELYDLAMVMRQKDDLTPTEFEMKRRQFAKVMLEETQRVTNYTWADIRGLLAQGFGKTGFYALIALMESMGAK